MPRTNRECLLSLETLVRSSLEGLTRPYISGRLQKLVFFLEDHWRVLRLILEGLITFFSLKKQLEDIVG